MSEHKERLRDWPTFLVLALGNPKIAEAAARLWQLALNDRDIGEMAKDSLDDWAEAAGGQQRAARAPRTVPAVGRGGRARAAGRHPAGTGLDAPGWPGTGDRAEHARRPWVLIH